MIKKIPASWIENKEAGKEWFMGSMRRRSNLAIRKPEATSFARAISFNKCNIVMFFYLLKEKYQDLGV